MGGFPSAWGPHPAPTGQLPHGRPSPSPAAAAAAGRASNPTPGPLPRPAPAPGGQWLRPEPPRGASGPWRRRAGQAGAGAPGGERLPACAQSGPAHAPRRAPQPIGAGRFPPRSQLGLVLLSAPSQEPKGTRQSGLTVAPRGPSRPSPPHTSAQESGHLTCSPPTPTPGL